MRQREHPLPHGNQRAGGAITSPVSYLHPALHLHPASHLRLILPFAAACLLASCGPGDNDPGPGGVTIGEARALDEAAEMLDAQRLPDEGPDEGQQGPQDATATPEPEGGN